MRSVVAVFLVAVLLLPGLVSEYLGDYFLDAHYEKMTSNIKKKKRERDELIRMDLDFMQTLDLKWQKGKREFIYANEFYDVVEFAFTASGKFEIIVVHDSQQKVFEKAFRKLNAGNDFNDPHKGKNRIFWTPLGTLFSEETGSSFTYVDFLSYRQETEKPESGIHTPVYSPPEIY